MANMKHCMFENTYNDLQDCYERLGESGVQYLEENANQYEKKYIKKLVQLCIDISEEFGDELED